jgi:predicted ATPase
MDPNLTASPEGLAAFGQLVDTQRAIGANVGVPYFAAVHASRLADAGQLDQAYAVSSRAVAEARSSGLHCWYAEILRLHARNCRLTHRLIEAESALTQAIDTATRQGAALWLIRAQLDQIAHGGPTQGLSDALAQFLPGADLPELHQARVLISQAAE